MSGKFTSAIIRSSTILLLILGMGRAACRAEQPAPAAVDSFNSYIHQLEARLDRQHKSPVGFMAGTDTARLRRGELVIEEVKPNPAPNLPGAMLHHWRGAAFAPGAHAADFERIMRSFAEYPKYFAPQVLACQMLSHNGDQYKVKMRVKQKHILTVVLDLTYDVQFGRLDRQLGYNAARSTNVSEIENAGEKDERALTPEQDHGFMWRLNTYWSYEERDGGLYLQMETVSLTRSIPTGLGWAVGPFVESVPKESLEFTLRSVCAALRR